MNRPRLLKVAKIAWTAVCGICCVLLVVLWVRSYSFKDLLHRVNSSGWMLGIQSDVDTTALIYAPLSTLPTPGMGPKGWFLQTTKAGGARHSGIRIRSGVLYLAAPYYVLTLAIAMVAVVPWLPFRFSLRTLLIATTLVGVVLALIGWTVDG